MSDHFDHGPFYGGGYSFSFETSVKTENRSLFEIPPQASPFVDSGEWTQMEMQQETSPWQPKEKYPWTRDTLPNCDSSAVAFQRPHELPDQPANFVRFSPGYSPTSQSSSSFSSSTSNTPIERVSPPKPKRSILQQLLEDDSPAPSPKYQPIPPPPKLSPKPKRKYVRKQKKQAPQTKQSQKKCPPWMKVYEENWLNEIYWFNFHDFMRTNYFDPMVQAAHPPEPHALMAAPALPPVVQQEQDLTPMSLPPLWQQPIINDNETKVQPIREKDMLTKKIEKLNKRIKNSRALNLILNGEGKT